MNLLPQSIETVGAGFFSRTNTNISDYIFSITQNNDLNDDIHRAIDDIKKAIANIPVSLKEAVDNHPAEVLNLHTKLTDLSVLLSVDAKHAVGHHYFLLLQITMVIESVF